MPLAANAIHGIRKKPIGVVKAGILLYLTISSNAIHGLRYQSPNVLRRDHVWYQGRDLQRLVTSYATNAVLDHLKRNAVVSAAASSRIDDDSFDSNYSTLDDGVRATNVPWVKYEMTPLPDSLIDTTIYVGNLGDFVTEDTLSRLFAQVSSLQTVPSAVARTPNNYSMGYAFVTFPTSEEVEVKDSRKKLNDKILFVSFLLGSVLKNCLLFLFFYSACTHSVNGWNYARRQLPCFMGIH